VVEAGVTHAWHGQQQLTGQERRFIHTARNA
jgi:hypothetical protein